MFGIVIATKRRYRQELQRAEDRALSRLVSLLQKKDSIYLEPVTLVGNGQTITDCVFLGSPGMNIVSTYKKDDLVPFTAATLEKIARARGAM